MNGSFHVHTTFCDGKNTVDEIVRAAIDRGMRAIGFSGHGYTPYDLRYCMQDTEGYIAQVRDAAQRYKDRICVLLGVEEDAFSPLDRSRFDYIIGSCHYFRIGGEYHPIDSSADYFDKCVTLFGGDTLTLARQYYRDFCEYILRRSPDVIGHFDLITKFDELGAARFLNDPAYRRIARAAVCTALKSGCVFEVNTGAIARGLRSAPYPEQELLALICREGGRVILSADSHEAATLEFGFDDARRLLRDTGFTHVCTLGSEGFTDEAI